MTHGKDIQHERAGAEIGEVGFERERCHAGDDRGKSRKRDLAVGLSERNQADASGDDAGGEAVKERFERWRERDAVQGAGERNSDSVRNGPAFLGCGEGFEVGMRPSLASDKHESRTLLAAFEGQFR